MNESLLKLLKRLPQLDAQLRAADFTVGPDRWQSVCDLVYRLAADNRLPEGSDQLASLIAPLFCNNRVEQNSFYTLFRHWAAGDFDSADVSEEVVHTSVLAKKQQRQYETKTRQLPSMAILLLLSLLTVSLIYFGTRPSVDNAVQPFDAPKTLEAIAGQEDEITTTPPPSAQRRDLEPIPPRQPAEPLTLDIKHQGDMRFIHYLLISLPVVILLVWLIRRWWRKQVVLRFHRNLQNDPLMYLKLRQGNKTLPFGWGEFSRRLKRGGILPTRKLDIDKTIDKTIHHAGLFTPVMLSHDPQPAYLVLMNRTNRHDHSADRADRLFERLKEANVTVYRFEYHDDPRICYSLGQSRRAYSLGQLGRHYAGCRLILVGDGDGLLDPFSGEIQRWVRLFESWQTRVLLTPAPQPWQAREALLAHNGFAVAPFQVNGLEAVSDWLLKPSLDAAVWFSAESDDNYPELFSLDEQEWLSSNPPQDYEPRKTCTTLYEYLGQSGYRLLAACAVYPQLVSILTITLDQLLFPADNGAQREQRVVWLSRLPWFRVGRMPDYLRRELLQRIDESVIERINGAYRQIFARVSESPGRQGSSLPFIVQAGGFKTYVRDLVRFAPQGSPMADSLFADVMFTGRSGPLDFVLPKNLSHWLPGKRYRLWPVLMAGVVTALLVAGMHVGWSWLSPVVEQEMIDQMKTANADITISISSHEDTRNLGDALEVALRNYGFVNVTRQYAKPLSEQVKIDTSQWSNMLDRMLNADDITGRVSDAIERLGPVFDKLFLSVVIGKKPLGSDEFMQNFSPLVADGLYRRIQAEVANPVAEFANQSRVGLRLQKLIDDWVNNMESDIDNAVSLLSSNSTSRLNQSLASQGRFMKVAEQSGSQADELDRLSLMLFQIIRNRLPELVMENMQDLSGEIAQSYQQLLNDALEQAGEARRNLPDAIVYLPGYQSSAAEIQNRLDYLSYGKTEYSLISDEGVVLKQGDSAVQVSINLSQPVVSGGVFRDGFVQESDARPSSIIKDNLSIGGLGPGMMVIPSGVLLMGSPESEAGRSSGESPQHEVRIGSFAMGKYEVTFDEYDRFAEATGRDKPDDRGWGRGKRPVTYVSWVDAGAYTAWLSEQTGQNYRLPTEAEWEYATRGGTTTRYSWGDTIDCNKARYGWLSDECGKQESTDEVGTFPANPFGLHDVHGNVWEWTQDCWHDSYEGALLDGSVWQEGGDCTRRVVRGGGWNSLPEFLRSAYRGWYDADVANRNLGFRLARTL